MDMASLIVAISLPTTSNIAVWVMPMECANQRLPEFVPLRVVMIEAAMAVVVAVQQRRAARREAERQARIQMVRENLDRVMIINKELEASRARGPNS